MLGGFVTLDLVRKHTQAQFENEAARPRVGRGRRGWIPFSARVFARSSAKARLRCPEPLRPLFLDGRDR